MDNLGRLLLEKFESISGAPALNNTGGTLSYRVLAGKALKVASALNSLGVSTKRVWRSTSVAMCELFVPVRRSPSQ